MRISFFEHGSADLYDLYALRHVYWAMLSWGDQVATGSVAGGCLLALALRREWSLMARFAALLAVAIVIEVGTKMAFYGWGIRFGMDTFGGMSGHTLRSFATYPSLGVILFAGSSHVRQMIGAAVGSLMALLVLAAIVLARVHTPVEAASGAVVGLVVPVLMATRDRLAPLRAGWRLAIFATVALLCARAPRSHFDFEKAIAHSAKGLKHWVGAQPCMKREGEVACEHGPAAAPEK